MKFSFTDQQSQMMFTTFPERLKRIKYSDHISRTIILGLTLNPCQDKSAAATITIEHKKNLQRTLKELNFLVLDNKNMPLQTPIDLNVFNCSVCRKWEGHKFSEMFFE